MHGPKIIIVPAGQAPYRWPETYGPTPSPVVDPPARGLFDILSDPERDMLARQTMRLMPRGRAWSNDEGGGAWGSRVIHGVARLIADGLASLYQTLSRAKNAAFPGFSDVGALADWEDELGIPGPCGELAATVDLRRGVIRAAIRPGGGCSRNDLLLLASTVTQSVDIREPWGFQCGFSECGRDAIGSATLNDTYEVTGLGTLEWLECGASELGTIGLGQASETQLSCVLDQATPSHVRYFGFSGA